MYILAESVFQIPKFTSCSYIVHLVKGLEVYVDLTFFRNELSPFATTIYPISNWSFINTKTLFCNSNKMDHSTNNCNLKNDVYAKQKKLISI